MRISDWSSDVCSADLPCERVLRNFGKRLVDIRPGFGQLIHRDERGHGDITYQAVTISPSETEAAVINLLRFHEAETALLFCATRDNVRSFHATLVERGFPAVALSGEHSHSDRNHPLQALRDRPARICVATDCDARGTHPPSLVHVLTSTTPPPP